MKAVCFMCLRVVYVHTYVRMSVHMLVMHATCIRLFVSLCVCACMCLCACEYVCVSTGTVLISN